MLRTVSLGQVQRFHMGKSLDQRILTSGEFTEIIAHGQSGPFIVAQQGDSMAQYSEQDDGRPAMLGGEIADADIGQSFLDRA